MKQKKVVPYTRQERNKKMTAIMFQLISIKLDGYLSDAAKAGIKQFIETGEEYKEVIDMPEFSREMHINLVNDKHKQTYIQLAFKKLIIDDNEKNPISKLNKLQENLFD